MTCQTVPHASDTLRRAEFELVLAGEKQLAEKVACIRHNVATLVRAIHAEREAGNELAQRSARREAQAAIAHLRGEPGA